MRQLKTNNIEGFIYIIRAIKELKFKSDFNILKHYRCSYRYIKKYSKKS